MRPQPRARQGTAVDQCLASQWPTTHTRADTSRRQVGHGTVHTTRTIHESWQFDSNSNARQPIPITIRAQSNSSSATRRPWTQFLNQFPWRRAQQPCVGWHTAGAGKAATQDGSLGTQIDSRCICQSKLKELQAEPIQTTRKEWPLEEDRGPPEQLAKFLS